MAIPFISLPPDAFPEAARPHIARLNVFLLELSRLEGTIRNPIQSRRSDATIARRGKVQVDVSRITPTIAQVVSGQSTVVGVPALTLGQTNVVGSTTTAVSVNSSIALFDTTAASAIGSSAATGNAAFASRRDHQHVYPTTLRSTANQSTVALTDNAVNQTLTGSLGELILQDSDGGNIHLGTGSLIWNSGAVGNTDQLTMSAGRMTWNPGTGGGAGTAFVVAANDATPAATTAVMQMRPSVGNLTGMNVSVVAAASAVGVTPSQTLRVWDAAFTIAAQIGSSANGTVGTIIPYNNSTFTLTPSAGSGNANIGYGAQLAGPLIANATGGWADIATLNLIAPRRSLTNPTITQVNTIQLECPTIGITTQAGIYIKQRTAQQTAATRYGMLIDAQNSGTARFSIYGTSDRAQFTGPLTVDAQLGVTGNATFGNSATITGNLDHDGSLIGFYNVGAGATQSTGWSVSNITINKTLNGSSFTLNDVMNTLGTLLTYLQVRGDVAA